MTATDAVFPSFGAQIIPEYSLHDPAADANTEASVTTASDRGFFVAVEVRTNEVRVDPTVLVVDDDPATCRQIAQTLTPQGYTVSIAGDGPSGLAAVAQARPALVILDVLLPEVDGLTVLTRLREDDPRLPIIVVSAASDVPTRLAAVPDVPDRERIWFLAKPFSLVTLQALVHHLLPNTPQSAARSEA